MPVFWKLDLNITHYKVRFLFLVMHVKKIQLMVGCFFFNKSFAHQVISSTHFHYKHTDSDANRFSML